MEWRSIIMEWKNLCCVVLPNLRTVGTYSCVEQVYCRANYPILYSLMVLKRKTNKHTTNSSGL